MRNISKYPFTSSVVSFPDRGGWGDQSYRGNCSGYIPAGFLAQYHKKENGLFVDPMEGSGTSRDLAGELGITYAGFDLRAGFDILTTDLRSQLDSDAHTVFLHPPYKDMIKYDSGPGDLSSFKDPFEFLEWCQLALMNVYAALEPEGHYAVLMGNMRKNGKYYPLASRLSTYAPGVQVHEIVKVQHNTRSARSFYGHTFIPTLHELLLVFQKPKTMVFALDVAVHRDKVYMKMIDSTWRNVVRYVMMGKGEDIYAAVKGSPRTRKNKHWQAKIRQVVQMHKEFERVAPGTYQIGEVVQREAGLIC